MDARPRALPLRDARSSITDEADDALGYSFAKFGARYPSAGGLLEYVVRAFGNGHVTGVVAWLLLATNAIITAMVAVSFGSYASAAFADGAPRGRRSSPSSSWS